MITDIEHKHKQFKLRFLGRIWFCIKNAFKHKAFAIISVDKDYKGSWTANIEYCGMASLDDVFMVLKSIYAYEENGKQIIDEAKQIIEEE